MTIILALTEASQVALILGILTLVGTVANALIGRGNRKRLEAAGSKLAEAGTSLEQLAPNGGKSLADKITRLDTRATLHDERFARIDNALDALGGTLGEVVGALGRMEHRQQTITGEIPIIPLTPRSPE